MPFAKGESGNPNGRPLGARNKATVVLETMLTASGEELTRGLIGRAHEGDTTALRLCLDRVLPRGPDRPVLFALPPVATGAQAREAIGTIFVATGAGDLTPREASDLLRVVERGARAIAAAEEAEHAAERRQADAADRRQAAQDVLTACGETSFGERCGEPPGLPERPTVTLTAKDERAAQADPAAARDGDRHHADVAASCAEGGRPDSAGEGAALRVGAEQELGPSLPGADASRDAGTDNIANNNENNENNEKTMPPAGPGGGGGSRWPVKVGCPDVPVMLQPGAAGVLARRRGGDVPRAETAVGLLLRDGVPHPGAPAR